MPEESLLPIFFLAMSAIACAGYGLGYITGLSRGRVEGYRGEWP